MGTVMGSVAAWFAFLLLYEKFGKGNESYIQIGSTLLFIIIQGAALRIVSDVRSGKSSFYCETLLTVTMLVEIFAASTVSIGLVAEHEGFAYYDSYGRSHEQVKEYVDSVEGTEGHKRFERSELFPNNVCDIQALYDVKGLAIFHSTARESFENASMVLYQVMASAIANANVKQTTCSIMTIDGYTIKTETFKRAEANAE